MRDGLIDIPNTEKFNIVAKWFSLAPLEKMTLDPEDCRNWRDPWTLVSDNNWCPVSVAIVMEATLRLSGVENTRIAWIIDRDASIQTMVVLVDNMVLNYDVGCVTLLQNCNLTIMYSWEFRENSYAICNENLTK
jgi:hypothetical protein